MKNPVKPELVGNWAEKAKLADNEDDSPETIGKRIGKVASGRDTEVRSPSVPSDFTSPSCREVVLQLLLARFIALKFPEVSERTVRGHEQSILVPHSFGQQSP